MKNLRKNNPKIAGKIYSTKESKIPTLSNVSLGPYVINKKRSIDSRTPKPDKVIGRLLIRTTIGINKRMLQNGILISNALNKI